VRAPSVAAFHATADRLEAGLAAIRESPREEGVLELIVRRTGVGQREILEQARLDVSEGLVGDAWLTRGSARTPDGSAHPDMQLNVMSSRVAALLAPDRAGWAMSGDQLYIDLDLGVSNLSPGTLLEIGPAIIAVTDQQHTSCKAFVGRYGVAAAAFVHSNTGRELRLRGINARVVRSGDVKIGDAVRKLSRA
jgi:hypothetical protein